LGLFGGVHTPAGRSDALAHAVRFRLVLIRPFSICVLDTTGWSQIAFSRGRGRPRWRSVFGARVARLLRKHGNRSVVRSSA